MPGLAWAWSWGLQHALRGGGGDAGKRCLGLDAQVLGEGTGGGGRGVRLGGCRPEEVEGLQLGDNQRGPLRAGDLAGGGVGSCSPMLDAIYTTLHATLVKAHSRAQHWHFNPPQPPPPHT